ncbi:MAG: peptide ABC transporter substrate-binding protein, partial [Pseudomonadota bacterium]
MTQLDYFKGQLVEGRISRREFLSRASALGLGALAASSLAATAVQAAGPQKGGTLRLALGTGSTTDSTDPATYNDTYMQVFGLAFRNNLTEVDNHDKLAGELAESWEASDDAS